MPAHRHRPNINSLWLGKSVPRYTSYPPAPVFHDGVGEEAYGEVLACLDPKETYSLYLHVPFCRNHCLYCGCHTFPTNRQDRIEAYLRTLEREIDLVADQIGFQPKVGHVHFGGGSPNIMTAEATERLMGKLRASFNFADCKEVAMELDPRLITQDNAKFLADNGVTRVSLGVQDFNPEVQKAVHREQSFDMVAQTCGWLRGAGIDRINFDLMYGLPLQTPQSLTETARLAVSLGPDRVSFFSYAHVPQIKPQQKALEVYGLPDKSALLDQESAGRAIWEQQGYFPIGMDHFAKPDDPLVAALKEGRLHRNFQGYTDDPSKALIGLGASSIGHLAEGFFQNERDLNAYQVSIDLGILPTLRGYLVTDEDRCRAEIIERFMCDLSCDLGVIAQKYGRKASSFAAEKEEFQRYVAGGLLRCEGEHYTLLTMQRMAIRVICAVFDAYAKAPRQASSQAA